MTTPPPLFNHAVKLYAAFCEKADEAPADIADSFGVQPGSWLYIGHWSTDFVGYPGLPGESTQQKAYAFLQNAGCLEVLRRGGRDYPGVILLKRAPVVEDADGHLDTRHVYVGKLGTLEVTTRGLVSRVAALTYELKVLNGRYDALVRDVELRLDQLDVRISTLKE
jgi:hypothetical protein